MRRRIVLAVLVLACALAGAPGALAASSDLYFSEYVEGSSNNKALEIFNGTGAPVDLAAGGYNVQMYFNGSASAGLTINLTGTVADEDVFVVAQSSASAAILAQADQVNASGWFNGDDAVVLRKGATILDVIGQIGFDPGTEWGTGLTSTADNTLRRKATITAGDPNGADAFDPSLEWDGFATDTFDGLGTHTVAGANAPVVVTCPPSVSVLHGLRRDGARLRHRRGRHGHVADPHLGDPGPGTGAIALYRVHPGNGDRRHGHRDAHRRRIRSAGTYTAQIGASNGDRRRRPRAARDGHRPAGADASADVQGSVSDRADGPTRPLAARPASGNGSSAATYFVRGVITQKTLARYLGRGRSRTASSCRAALGADRRRPDQLRRDLRLHGRVHLADRRLRAAVGDEVVLAGPGHRVLLFTELSSAAVVAARRPGARRQRRRVAVADATPPDELADADRYWERHEGMRGARPRGQPWRPAAATSSRPPPTPSSGRPP